MSDYVDSQYRDINLEYVPGGAKGQAVIAGYMTIRESLRNILFTQVGSRFFNRRFGSMLDSLLFEPISEETAFTISNILAADLPIMEPRIEVNPFGVIVEPDPENNCYKVTLNVLYKVTDQDLTMSAVLERKY